MTVTFVDVPDRQTLATHLDNDFQPWKGWAKANNLLSFGTRATARKRTRCTIDQASQYFRREQDPRTFNGHFPNPGEPIITTANVGQIFKLSFEKPVTAIGFEVEPVPITVVPGQSYRVFMTLNCVDGTREPFAPRTGIAGSCLFIGTQGDLDSISGIELSVKMVESDGRETPVNYGINRLELLASPH